jgi:hypothetical protein
MKKEKRVYVINCENGFDFREKERNGDYKLKPVL